ncbi:MAG: CCA tRNA nucleotidyltransferase [Candidatus Izemoplasmatales bacterium]
MDRSHSLGKLILKKFNDSGYEAYFVGGFVRDYLLGIESSDIDITTNATPDIVEKLFLKTKATGKKYGTITVFIEEYSFEVTTYRIDQNYLNYRKPETVVYSTKLEEDLKRRDFTINALAMDVDSKIYDLYNGQTDLKNKIIRAIGNPDERFSEDALRIIRALRFSSRLNFKIEDNTLFSMRKNMDKLTHISNERIIPELEEIFNNPYNKLAILLMESIRFSDVYKEFDKGLKLYQKSKIDLSFKEFFALCLFVEKMDMPNYWRFSNKDKLLICRLMHVVKTTHASQFNILLIYKLGLNICLSANKINRVLNRNYDQEKTIMDLYKRLPIKSRDELKLNGNDLKMIRQINNEEIIGEVLEELEFQVINDHLENEVEELKQYAFRLMERIDG